MTIKSVPCYTVICDGCEIDAARWTDWSGFGPGPSDAVEALCDGWNVKDDKHFCATCKPSWCLECDADITPENPRCDDDVWSCASCHTDCGHEEGASDDTSI